MRSSFAPRRRHVVRAFVASVLVVLHATVPTTFAVGQDLTAPLRGDADGVGGRIITDAVVILEFLFRSGPPPVCRPVADVNADGGVDIADPVFLLGYLFRGQAAPSELDAEEALICRGLDPAAVLRGMKVFEQPDPNGNLFSCALCHSTGPYDESDLRRPGHTLLDVLARPSYKGGGRDSFLGAVNVCRYDWMVTTEWEEDDADFQDLLAFMESLATTDSAPALEFEIVAPARDGPPAADASADDGCRLFNRSCAVCHADGAMGSMLAPSLVDTFVLDLDDPDYIRRRIRLSGPNDPDSVYELPPGVELVGSVMPFWSADKLSDEEVEDITAFLAAARQAARDGGAPFDCEDDPPPQGEVLRRGEFVGLFHGVGGIAEELDSRQIRLRQFNYDGGGITVKVWLYMSGEIRSGRAIGPDLFRPGNPYVDETIVIDIPDDIDSSSFDSVSIWCVSARQDFGSTQLEPVTP